MSELAFLVQFHGPFRVGTGRGRDGVDAALDLHDPVPASHLKGVMRASAREVMGDVGLDEVFGGQGSGSPWAWDSAYPLVGDWQDLAPRVAARISIDDGMGTARPDHLQLAAQLWPPAGFRARFTVVLAGPLPAERRLWHEAVLRLAARATTALGGQRRRGLGWVTVRPEQADSRERVAADVRLARRGVG